MSRQLRNAARAVVDYYTHTVTPKAPQRRAIDFRMATLVDALHRELAVDSDRVELSADLAAMRRAD